MNNDQKRKLCLGLMRAGSEQQVIAVLKTAEFWDRRRFWRLHGNMWW